MKYDIYLYDIADNGRIVGCWWERAEFVRFYPSMIGRWYIDKHCAIPATLENIY